jgi:hypothetical protein
MKQTRIYMAIAALTFSVLFSCKKDLTETTEIPKPIMHQKSNPASNNTSQISLFNDILSFKDFEVLVNTMNDLNTAQDQANDAFFENKVNYSLDEISAMNEQQLEQLNTEIDLIANEIGFNEENEYANFENSFGFYSMRQHLNQLEESWLDADEPDWDNSPQRLFSLGKAEKAVYNPYCEIMVQGVIYKYLNDGSCLLVADGDYSTLLQLRQNPLSYANFGNVEFKTAEEVGGSRGNCDIRNHSKDEFTTSGSSKIECYGWYKIFSGYTSWGSSTSKFMRVGSPSRWVARRDHLRSVWQIFDDITYPECKLYQINRSSGRSSYAREARSESYALPYSTLNHHAAYKTWHFGTGLYRDMVND